MSPEQTSQAVESGEINLALSCLTVPVLELILTVLAQRGNVHVTNCGGVMSLMELGAYLAEQAKRNA